MLVDPVRHQPTDDVVLPPLLGAGCCVPTHRRCSSRRSSRGRRRSSRWARWRRTTARSPATMPRGTATCTPRSRRRAREAGRTPGRDRMSLRELGDALAGLRRRVVRVDLIAEEDRQLRPLVRRLIAASHSAYAYNASTPRPRVSSASSRLHGGSCGAAVRHEPNTIRLGVSAPPSVWIRLAGNGAAPPRASAARRSTSRRTRSTIPAADPR